MARSHGSNGRPPAEWLKLGTYAALYDVDPRTVRKWAASGLVELVSVQPVNARRIIWVKNHPPWLPPQAGGEES